jgi:uncharacterized membrane protein YbhN (UPF0104 family)
VKPRRIDGSVLLRLVLAGAALGYLAYVVDPAALLAAAAAARPAWIAAAVALLPLNLALQAFVWYGFARLVMPGVAFGSASAAMMCGHTLGLITPANAGDLVGRSFYLPHADKWELGTAAFVHRMFDMAACTVVGAFALFPFVQATAPAPPSFWKGLTFAGVGLSVLLTAMAVLPRQTYRLAARLLRRPAWQRRIAFLGRLPSGAALVLLAASFAGYAVFTTQFFFLLRAFTPEAEALTGYQGIALVYFVKNLIPALTLFDVGIREGAAVYFLGRLGYPQAAAFNAAFLLFCINLLLPALAGLPFVFRLRFGRPARPAASPVPAQPTS